jgi:alkylation response protein AidB-like acyl-CoA dehydrogenase
MEVLFDETEEMLRRSARAMLEAESPPQLARDAETDPRGYSVDLWEKIAELGWLGLALPEAYGGQELGLTYLGIIAAELGRTVAPVPFHATMMAALTIAAEGSAEQRSNILPSVAQGQRVLTWAFIEDDPRLAPQAVKLQARQDGDGFVLNGVKRFVEYGDTADACVVVCRTLPDSSGTDGISLLLVDLKSAGIDTSKRYATIAKENIGEVTFSDVRVPAENLIGTLHEGWPAAARMLDRGIALLCAQMAGASRKALEFAVEYAKHRTAFGRPIGAFQTIAHTCANMLIAVEGAELLSYEALWRLDNGLPAEAEVSQAKAFCSEACLEAVRNANVIHGGLALTEELNLNLWYRRVATWATRLGTAPEHRARVATSILGPVQASTATLPQMASASV